MKRFFSAVLALTMIFASFCGTAFAVEAPDPRASLTLSDHSAEIYTGSSRGAVYINYDVESSKYADTIGVESITFYRSDGSRVATVSGSTRNGLIITNTNIHIGDYDYTLTSGVDYYAKVKVFARAGSEYDSRTITTSTITAP